jgi:hypothetical protein
VLRQREGLLDFRQPLRVEFDQLGRHRDAATLDLLGVGIVDGAGHAIRLRMTSPRCSLLRFAERPPSPSHAEGERRREAAQGRGPLFLPADGARRGITSTALLCVGRLRASVRSVSVVCRLTALGCGGCPTLLSPNYLMLAGSGIFPILL